MRLGFATPPAWAAHILENFNTFLADHAACERKASATAMSLVAHYSDKPELVTAMISVAQEELEHFSQVWGYLHGRGLSLARDEKDPYVKAILALVRSAPETYLMDRLLAAAVIEARGCERFGLLAAALPDNAEMAELKKFYTELTAAEARHHGLFARLAKRYYGAAEVELRLAQLLEQEAKIVAALPLRAALH